MSGDRASKTQCFVCKKQFQIMKRCTKCKDVFYCSRDCQVRDWPQHKLVCGGQPKMDLPRRGPTSFSVNDDSIFGDSEEGKVTESQDRKIHPPLVDFSSVGKRPQHLSQTSDSVTLDPDAKIYMHNNEIRTDVPVLDETQPVFNINIRCNKEKLKVPIQKSWTGEEIFKVLSHLCKVPLEKLKLIHKGRVLSMGSVTATLSEKALYQVIGEQAADETGIDQRDISVLMKQTGLDRNQAVQSLRQKGDLIDALLGQ